jgi:hypothetical protein
VVSEIFSWNVAAWVVTTALAGGFVTAQRSPAYAKALFAIAFAWLTGALLLWLVPMKDGFLQRFVVPVLLFGGAGLGLLETLRYVNHGTHKAPEGEPTPPAVATSIVPLATRTPRPRKNDVSVQHMESSPGGVQIGQVQGSVTINESRPRRRLSEQDESRLIAALKEGVGSRITIASSMSDEEAISFASQLVEAFERAGWHVIVSQFMQPVPGPQGLQVRVHDRNTVPRVAALVRRSLDTVGYKTVGIVDAANVKPGDFELTVGPY